MSAVQVQQENPNVTDLSADILLAVRAAVQGRATEQHLPPVTLLYS
jgi:hypothetical protein